MARPSKPMAKNSNSKFTTRNNKQDIFSKIAKASKPNSGMKVRLTDTDKENNNQPR